MRRTANVLMIIASTAAAGCGGPGTTAKAPPVDEARRHLVTALDAWRAGKVKGLASASPPIRFVDPDQAAGARLDGYKPGDDPTTVDHVVDYPVELTITDRKKATRTVQAAYQVVAEPALAVLRNDP
ncbi:hypothetical protein [Paludisphaera mucosa]|uniref:Uncharacterized protein n=1 Tax=Paludisphaera mucosa TaxID=3030827 RepID=A0ABT6FJV9_9BACT|nr:hypothetical protein [Paludisphaera mucosa]MDG3007861.1 hypothetical protein [Paludisphaera mucosa]